MNKTKRGPFYKTPFTLQPTGARKAKLRLLRSAINSLYNKLRTANPNSWYLFHHKMMTNLDFVTTIYKY